MYWVPSDVALLAQRSAIQLTATNASSTTPHDARLATIDCVSAPTNGIICKIVERITNTTIAPARCKYVRSMKRARACGDASEAIASSCANEVTGGANGG